MRQVIDLEMDSELLADFIQEAKVHIANMEAGLLAMENGESNDDTIHRIFRAAHSIKGTAGFFELDKIVQLAHCIETLFGEFRDRRLQASSGMIDVLLKAADQLKDLVNHPEVSHAADIAGNLTTLKQLLKEIRNSSVGQEALSVEPVAAVVAAVLPPQIAVTVACETPPVQTVAEKEPLTVTALQQQPRDGREAATEDNIRVSVSVLNDLLNLAGELVVWRNQLLRIVEEPERQGPQLEIVARGIDELATNLQKNVMKTRMQPISHVFNKFPRIVRDLSRKTDKEIDLVMKGMNVELDRSLIEALVDPLTHLVRNAIDHGIECPKTRQAAGKPVAGSLVLHAYQESDRVIIDISDDGAGINPGQIKSKAIQKGLAGATELEAMDEADIINLIMRPGFSLAEKITDLSGRGVGMDVVKTNIEQIGGKVEIISEQGAGTTFRLILPLTLAIISALIVVANEQYFVIPQANIKEFVLIHPGETSEKTVKMVQGRPVLLLRGRLIPLVGLSDVLAAKDGPDYRSGKSWLAGEGQTLRILIIKAGNAAYGLVVDSIYDTEEILVKPLPAVLGDEGLYSGVTVLGDGSIVMILDTEKIRLQSGLPVMKDSSPQSVNITVRKNVEEEKQYILLFACSGGEKLGLDLAMVSRVEEIDPAQLQKIGSKYYFVFQGQTIRVIRPEYYVPISRKKNALSKLYIILPKLMKHSIGIVAERVYDAVYTTISLDKDGVSGTGIVGSALINDTVVTLLDIHEMFAKAAPEYYTGFIDRKRLSGKSYPANFDDVRKTTVLLVEDTPFFLKVIKNYLESEGYEVITAENGRDAYELLNQIPVDLVVSDIEMPVMTGIELVRAIRDNDVLRDLPVVALTSLTGAANKEKGLRAGFDVYEYKLDRTRLLDTIRALLRKRAGGK